MNSSTPVSPAGSASLPARRRIIVKRRILPIPPHATAAAPEPQIDAAAARSEEQQTGSNWRDDGSYVVGKGKTPVHTRWQKGQSGNPRGKKKGTPNTDTIIIDLMETPITVKTASGERKMSRKAALFQRMWEMAAKGDLKAAKFLFDRYSEAQGRRPETEVEDEGLSETDRSQLDSFMAALRLGTEDAGSGALS
jgi:hypothetical protein